MAENNTAEHTQRLAALRRLDSADKARRVLAALDATLGTGEPLTIAALARRAGVSRRFIYDHPELRAEAGCAAPRPPAVTPQRLPRAPGSPSPRYAPTSPTPRPPATGSPPSTPPSAARLGQDALAGLDPATSDTSAASGRLPQLEQALFEAGEQLAQRTEELQAARQINRELISRLNREHR